MSTFQIHIMIKQRHLQHITVLASRITLQQLISLATGPPGWTAAVRECAVDRHSCTAAAVDNGATLAAPAQWIPGAARAGVIR
jgi:hypothetical protein